MDEGNTGAGSTIRPTVGMHVKSRFNESWGVGMVCAAQGESVRVLFPGHPERKPVLVPVRSLHVVRAGEWAEAATKVQEREEQAATRAKAASRPARRYATTNQEQALAGFLEAYPGGFTGARYLAEERTPKWEAHQAFEALLGGGKLRAFLQQGQVEEATRCVLEVERKTNLLFPTEKSRLTAALRDAPAAQGFLAALASVLEAPEVDEQTFGDYLKAVEALPGVPGQRVASWTVATLLPFLAQPARHLFLKPVATRAAAERLQLDLHYDSALNWTTYRKVLDLGAALTPLLAPHGCRDLMDVQGYIWLTG
ncbi:MAG: hypothetical protein IPO09_20440 [Anaeromyxobacter sp.]|nr:hypothetical protein [Anaeromyxobacter sp.]MBL0274840.1 hypothetical protein [Anaeromyxobacter sp.]